MATETLTKVFCDKCGCESGEDVNVKTMAFKVDRTVDAAGSMNDVWAYADVCLLCIARMLTRFLKDMPEVERLKYLEAQFGNKLRIE